GRARTPPAPASATRRARGRRTPSSSRMDRRSGDARWHHGRMRPMRERSRGRRARGPRRLHDPAPTFPAHSTETVRRGKPRTGRTAVGPCPSRRRQLVRRDPMPIGRSVLMRTLVATVLVVLALAPAARAADVKLDTEDQKTLYAIGLLLSQNLSTFNLTQSELETVEAGSSGRVLAHGKKAGLDTHRPESGAEEHDRHTAAH